MNVGEINELIFKNLINLVLFHILFHSGLIGFYLINSLNNYKRIRIFKFIKTNNYEKVLEF